MQQTYDVVSNTYTETIATQVKITLYSTISRLSTSYTVDMQLQRVYLGEVEVVPEVEPPEEIIPWNDNPLVNPQEDQ